jgi:hypothetical protein
MPPSASSPSARSAFDRGARSIDLVSGRGQTVFFRLAQQLHLPRLHLDAEFSRIHALTLRLGEDALARLLLFLDVVLDVFGEDLDLGVVHRRSRAGLHHVVDQDLGAVMLDLRLVHLVFFHVVAAAGRIEDLFLQRRVDDELIADLLDQLLLAPALAFSAFLNRASTLRWSAFSNATAS